MLIFNIISRRMYFFTWFEPTSLHQKSDVFITSLFSFLNIRLIFCGVQL